MRPEDLKNAFPPVPEDFHNALLATAHGVEEESPVRRKKTWVLVLALALALLCGTALAFVNRFSVRQYHAGENPTQEYIANITSIEETFENEYISLTLTDAVFDGRSIAIAMNLISKDPSSPVYLSPILSAECDGRPLGVDIITCQGDFFNGFLFPNIEGKDQLEGNYGIDAMILDNDIQGEVTWTLTVAVLKPNWPLRAETAGLTGNVDSEAIDAYLARFEEAYAQEEILVASEDRLVEFSGAIPIPENMTLNTFALLDTGERLALSDAFTLVDTVRCAFTASKPENARIGIGHGLTFPTEDYTVEFDGIDVTFMHLRYSFSLVFETDEDMNKYKGGQQVFFDIFTPDGIPYGTLRSTGAGFSSRPGNRVAYDYFGELYAEEVLPDALMFVPYTEDNGVIAHDPARSFTIHLAD